MRELITRGEAVLSIDISFLFAKFSLLQSINFIYRSVTEHHPDADAAIERLRERVFRCTCNIQLLLDDKRHRQKDVATILIDALETQHYVELSASWNLIVTM